MANKNILTNNAKVSQIDLLYYAPVAVVPPAITTPINSFYCFLSKPTPWANDAEPTTPTADLKSIKQIYKNIFVAKQIKTSDISPIIQRIDWTANETYDYFEDDVDMTAKDANGYLVKHFYVKNKYDQIFKCLWNNKGNPSTREPYFEPGTYSVYNFSYDRWVHSIRNKPYFTPTFPSSQMVDDIYTFKDKLFSKISHELTLAVIKRCVVTERPVACLLSGGLDSSLIAALVADYFRLNGKQIEILCVSEPRMRQAA
jgi:hypothetical protein